MIVFLSLTPQHLASTTISTAYILSHPVSSVYLAGESFITLLQQTTVVICTIFHVSNQRSTHPGMTAAVCALLNHERMSAQK